MKKIKITAISLLIIAALAAWLFVLWKQNIINLSSLQKEEKIERVYTQFESFKDLNKEKEEHIITKDGKIKLEYNTYQGTIGYSDFDITYPEIYGLSNKEFEINLNRKIQESCKETYDRMNEITNAVEDEIYSAKEKNDYELVQKREEALQAGIKSYYDSGVEYWINGDILSIVILTHIYGFGAAHPLSWIDTYNVDLNNNKILQLSDLISDKNGTQKILEEVNRQIEEREIYIFNSSEGKNQLEELEDPQYYIKDNTLIIHYNPYDITAYAAGHIEFEMPYQFKNNHFIVK